MPWITHMLIVDLIDNFSCQEFRSLLCNCSVKGCRENIMVFTSFDAFILPLENPYIIKLLHENVYLFMKKYHLNPQSTYV